MTRLNEIFRRRAPMLSSMATRELQDYADLFAAEFRSGKRQMRSEQPSKAEVRRALQDYGIQPNDGQRLGILWAEVIARYHGYA